MSSETPYLQVDADDVAPTLMLFLVLVTVPYAAERSASLAA